MARLPFDLSEAGQPDGGWYRLKDSTISDIWIEFGEHEGGRLVDISDSESDVFVRVPAELAKRIIALRTKFTEDLIDTINAWKAP